MKLSGGRADDARLRPWISVENRGPELSTGPGRWSIRGVIRTVAFDLLALPWAGVLLGIVLLGVVLTFSAPCGCFLTQDDILTIARTFSFVGIASLGGAMVIMTRGIDLSVGSNMALSGLVTAEVLARGVPALLAVSAGLSVGLAVGLANGFLITVVGLQPFIATLGMLSVVRGVGLVVSQGFPIYAPSSFGHWGQGAVGPIPIPVVVMVLITSVLVVFLNNTSLGRHIYAVGGNESAARLLGINTKRVKVIVYALAGVLGAVGGILLMSFLSTADPGAATGYELDVIAAAVIGGVSLFGGQGSLIGVILGAALIAQIRTGLVLMQVPGFWTTLVIGLVILCAMAIDQARRLVRRAWGERNEGGAMTR